MPDDAVERDTRHGTGGKKVDSEGRRDHAQREVDHHDDPKVNRINAKVHRHRHQNRSQHDDGC